MRKIHRAYKVELAPTNKQRVLLRKAAGTARYVWNWGLSHRIRLYNRTQKSMDAMRQHKIINRLKQTKLSWMYEVSKCVPQEALRDLEQSYSNFFEGRSSFPKFKKKSSSNDSFRLYGTIKVHKNGRYPNGKKIIVRENGCRRKSYGNEHYKNHECSLNCSDLFSAPRVQLPRLGTIRIKEVPNFRDTTRILSATVSRKVDRWFVSFGVEEEIEKLNINLENPKLVGVDLGLKHLAILSEFEGTTGDTTSPIFFKNSRALKNKMRKLRKLSKSLARKTKGSKNRQKAKKKLGKLHSSIRNLRKDTIHKLTTFLAKNYTHIVIEDLNVREMMQNNKLSRAISDVGWGEFRSQLEYKCNWYHSELIIAPRFYPSSKMCSKCNQKKESLQLYQRIFSCNNCGLVLDRDFNAALNLKIFGEKYVKDQSVAESWAETLNACGDSVRPSNTEEGNYDEAGTELQT